MRIQRRWLTGALLTIPVTMGRIPSASAQSDEALEYYHQAKINWRQGEGQSLTIGLNKHPFTESLLPLIPEPEFGRLLDAVLQVDAGIGELMTLAPDVRACSRALEKSAVPERRANTAEDLFPAALTNRSVAVCRE